MTGKDTLIRAVVVDDSPTARELLVSLLQNTQGIQVVGTGQTGEDAVRLAKRLRPDVMTLDVHMKGMDGFAATRQIMRESPLPIILVTSSLMRNETDLTFQALNAGALTVARKPSIDDPDTCAQLVKTVQIMAGVPVVHHWGRNEENAQRQAHAKNVAQAGALMAQDVPEWAQINQLRMIAVAASTGGPGALANVFRPLPVHFSWPILVVQHITKGFGAGMVHWIGTQTALPVRMAEHREIPQPGVILFAPDDYHMQLNPKGEIELVKGEPYRGLRPSANALFQSVAAVYRSAALAILLTGMGNDGAEGMAEIYHAGGFTIAQNQESCTIYGMPKAAVERQVVSQILSLDGISRLLCSFAAIKKSEVQV